MDPYAQTVMYRSQCTDPDIQTPRHKPNTQTPTHRPLYTVPQCTDPWCTDSHHGISLELYIIFYIQLGHLFPLSIQSINAPRPPSTSWISYVALGWAVKLSGCDMYKSLVQQNVPVGSLRNQCKKWPQSSHICLTFKMFHSGGIRGCVF